MCAVHHSEAKLPQLFLDISQVGQPAFEIIAHRRPMSTDHDESTLALKPMDRVIQNPK